MTTEHDLQLTKNDQQEATAACHAVPCCAMLCLRALAVERPFVVPQQCQRIFPAHGTFAGGQRGGVAGVARLIRTAQLMEAVHGLLPVSPSSEGANGQIDTDDSAAGSVGL